MSGALGGRNHLRAGAETLACGAVAAWVGGHAVLGAYAARIVFRDLPRPEAATTMTTIFRSFDTLIVVALGLLAMSLLARAAALGPAALRGANLAAAGSGALLLVVGAISVGWVHPSIEHMFQTGDTLSPQFAALHKLSEKLGHTEALLALSLFGSFAWARAAAE